MQNLEGKHTLVTGASRGIGRSCAELFLKHGAKVTALARSAEALNSLVKAHPDRCFMAIADLEKPADIAQLCNDIDHLDILVHNAGYFKPALIPDLSDDEFNRHLQVNMTAAFQLTRGLWPALKNNRGSIVYVSSLAGVQNFEKFATSAAYVAAKSALSGFAEVVAAEGREHGIRANVVSPGAVDTDMLRNAYPGMRPDFKPEDIARHILHMASEDSAPVSGSNLVVQI